MNKNCWQHRLIVHSADSAFKIDNYINEDSTYQESK